jgi:hypothetical protein
LSLIKGGDVSYSQIWNEQLLVCSNNMSMYMPLTISAVFNREEFYEAKMVLEIQVNSLKMLQILHG